MKAENRRFFGAGLILATPLFVTPVGATLVAYEGFQYVDAFANAGDYSANSGVIPESLFGESDGSPGDVNATGLAGSWNESSLADNDDWYLIEGSLSFGDAPTAGNRVGYNSLLDLSGATRALDAGAQATIDLGSALYFSILASPTERASASRGGFAITNTALQGGAIINTTNQNGVAGFGFGSPGSHNWRPYVWTGTGRIDGDAALTTTLNETYMLVGELTFNTGPGGTDEFTLYNYLLNEGSLAGGTLDPIASTIAVDLDESSLDLLNLNRQRYWEADEIRIGTELSDVIVIPEPQSLLLLSLGLAASLRRRR